MTRQEKLKELLKASSEIEKEPFVLGGGKKFREWHTEVIANILDEKRSEEFKAIKFTPIAAPILDDETRIPNGWNDKVWENARQILRLEMAE